MPKMSGVELLHKVHFARLGIPVVMVSGNLPQDAFAKYPWIKPAATLVKPYSIAKLVETVKYILGASNGDPSPIPIDVSMG